MSSLIKPRASGQQQQHLPIAKPPRPSNCQLQAKSKTDQSQLACEGCYTKALMLSQAKVMTKVIADALQVKSSSSDGLLELLELISEKVVKKPSIVSTGVIPKVSYIEINTPPAVTFRAGRNTSLLTSSSSLTRTTTSKKKQLSGSVVPSPIREYDEDWTETIVDASNASTITESNVKLSSAVECVLKGNKTFNIDLDYACTLKMLKEFQTKYGEEAKEIIGPTRVSESLQKVWMRLIIRHPNYRY